MKLYLIIKIKQFANNSLFSYKLLILTLTILTCISCDPFVDTELPNSEITGVSVFEDDVTVDAALSNIYAELREYSFLSGSGFGISGLMGLYADEFTYYGNPSITQQDFFSNSVMPSNKDISNFWNFGYNIIYQSNAIIEGLEQSEEINNSQKDIFTGEALFIRALSHYYLLNLFGDIPYITTTDYRENSSVSRKTEPEIYQQIKLDLERAKDLLPEEYIDSYRTRPNNSVAGALLARLYLYTKDWQTAEKEASEIINRSNLYELTDNLNEVFLKESSSTIWQLNSGSEGKNTLEALSFKFTNTPPPSLSLSINFIESIETGDNRMTEWIGFVSSNEQTFYFPNKYKERENTGTSLEYSKIFRLAEIYLIRAEARAQQGELSAALGDLNEIRNRAGLLPLQGLTKGELLEAILKERRVELFSELGHRFFDLKHTGNIQNVLGDIKPGWNSYNILLPIPENELITNPNLGVQNPGY